MTYTCLTDTKVLIAHDFTRNGKNADFSNGSLKFSINSFNCDNSHEAVATRVTLSHTAEFPLTMRQRRIAQ